MQVAVVADTVEISIGEGLLRSHRIRHDRTRACGALANPGGRPNCINAALPAGSIRQAATGVDVSADGAQVGRGAERVRALLDLQRRDLTGNDSERWMNRWKPALNAFAVTFEGRLFPNDR